MENQVQKVDQLPEQPTPIKPKKAFKKWVLIAIVLLLILSLPLGGYILLGKMSIKPQSSSITIITPTPTPNLTINSKTYSGKTFQVKVPNDFTLAKDPSLDTYKGPAYEDYLYFTNKNKTITLTIQVSKDAQDLANSYLADKQKIKIDSENAIKGDYITGQSGDGFQSSVIFNHSNFGYIISVNIKDSVKNRITASDLIDNILSTFKFIDQTSTTPTCKPRPACLDAKPRCMIAETADMCPPTATPAK